MRSARWATTAVGSVACALTAPLAMCECAPRAPEVGAPDPGLRGHWVPISASDGSSSSGRGNCSDYTATIYGSERSLWMKTIVVPLGFSCTTTEKHALQRRYAEVAGEIVPRNLPAIDRIDCLRSTDNASRDFTRILGRIDVPPDPTGTWAPVSGTDATGTITRGTAPVTFTFKGTSSGGRGPCNSFGATATGTTTGSIHIEVGIHTNMAGLGPQVNSTESRYFAALDAVTTAAPKGESLSLTEQGASLVFQQSTP